MGKLIAFDVIIANQPAVFISGQQNSVTGTVIVNLSEPMQMRGIRIRLSGIAHSQVSTGSGKDRHTHHEYETYLDNQITVWGKESGDRTGENPVLPAGRYDFNFNFMLPANIRMPSSFEGAFCYIRYMIIANIDKPWKFDHVAKHAFTVLESIDVNQPALMQRPLPVQNEKYLCCCCCKSGPLQLTASIDRSGYCPGEMIVINAQCQNLTNKAMQYVRARLNRIVLRKARAHSRTVIGTKYEIRSSEEIRQGQNFNWTNQYLQIPSVAPSIDSCGIIKVSYELQVSIVVPGGINLHVSIPIVMGTIPLQQQSFMPIVPMQPLSNIPPGSQPPPAGFATANEMQPLSAGFATTDTTLPAAPPPTYQQCADGTVDIKDAEDSNYLMGQRNFAPMYTFVNNFQPQLTQPSS